MKCNRRTACGSLMALALCLLPAGLRADHAPADPARFAGEVASIEKRDIGTTPPQNGIVFIGSSNIRKWPLAKSFPDLPAINHGFGGSQLSDCVFYFDRLVTPFHPRLVVLHAGGNDLTDGRSPAQIVADLEEFTAKLHMALPDARLVYIGLFPAPIRAALQEQYHETTRLVHAFLRHEHKVTFIDPAKALLTRQGEIRPELYEGDHLHLNAQGYELLTHYVAGDIKRASKAAGVESLQ